METTYRILPRKKIDLTKWDDCVQSDSGHSLYGLSWFLDATCPSWNGIVKGDYTAVFPLCLKSKFSFKYLFQPIGLQSVKWYSPSPICQLDYCYLFSTLFTEFHFIDINISLNSIAERKQLERFEIKSTQILNIEKSNFRHHYSKRVNYSIRKAQRSNLKLIKSYDPKLFLKIVLKSATHDKIENFKKIRKAIELLIIAAKNKGQMWFGYIDNKPVTAALLMENKSTLYFSFLFTLEAGLKICINHILIDQIIETNRDKFQALDFSGSNMEGIAFFNKGFGAEDRHYIHINTRKALLRNWLSSFV